MTFSVSHATLPVSRLGVHKKLGGEAARTDVPSWPKGYPVQYKTMLSNKSWGGRGKGRMFRVMMFAFLS